MNIECTARAIVWSCLLSACGNSSNLSRQAAREAIDSEAFDDVALAAGDDIIVDTTPNFAADDAGVADVLDHCTTNSGPSMATLEGEPLIDDFDDGDAFFFGDGRAGLWFAYDDMTGTQTPGANGTWQATPGGLTADGQALRVSGGGFSVWGSGQGLVLAVDTMAQPCVYDASVFDGITFWARGSIEVEDETLANPLPLDRGVLRVLLIEPGVVPVSERGECDETSDGLCWDSHRVRVELGSCWRRYSVPFSDFLQDGWGASAGELDTDRLFNLNFELSPNHSFDFELDEVQFFRGDPPAELEDCDLPPSSTDAVDATGDAAGAVPEAP